MSKLAIVGAGAWGTALALQGVRAGHLVALVARDSSTARAIARRRENIHLPGANLPDEIELCHNIPAGIDLLLWAVPTQQLRSSILSLGSIGRPIVVCAKGVEAKTHLLPLEVVADVSPGQPLAVLTGPNFAHEVARGLPAAAVVASTDPGFREQVLRILATNNFRLYGNDDAIGAQLGGASKNVIAIAAGAVIGA